MSNPTWRQTFDPPFYYDEEGNCIMHQYGKVLDMRGWGHLTGGGMHNLPPEVAAKIQDDFGRELADLLNGIHKKAPPL